MAKYQRVGFRAIWSVRTCRVFHSSRVVDSEEKALDIIKQWETQLVARTDMPGQFEVEELFRKLPAEPYPALPERKLGCQQRPIPPGHLAKLAGHHWLEVLDYSGHSEGLVVMQWQPVAKLWCQSGRYGDGPAKDSDGTEGWRYVGPIELPDF